jgi:diadenosine tetraphosphate (Ap4A) HIT family hydrolase
MLIRLHLGFSVTDGHLLVCTRRHVADWFEAWNSSLPPVGPCFKDTTEGPE